MLHPMPSGAGQDGSEMTEVALGPMETALKVDKYNDDPRAAASLNLMP